MVIYQVSTRHFSNFSHQNPSKMFKSGAHAPSVMEARGVRPFGCRKRRLTSFGSGVQRAISCCFPRSLPCRPPRTSRARCGSRCRCSIFGLRCAAQTAYPPVRVKYAAQCRAPPATKCTCNLALDAARRLVCGLGRLARHEHPKVAAHVIVGCRCTRTRARCVP